MQATDPREAWSTRHAHTGHTPATSAQAPVDIRGTRQSPQAWHGSNTSGAASGATTACCKQAIPMCGRPHTYAPGPPSPQRALATMTAQGSVRGARLWPQHATRGSMPGMRPARRTGVACPTDRHEAIGNPAATGQQAHEAAAPATPDQPLASPSTGTAAVLARTRGHADRSRAPPATRCQRSGNGSTPPPCLATLAPCTCPPRPAPPLPATSRPMDGRRTQHTRTSWRGGATAQRRDNVGRRAGTAGRAHALPSPPCVAPSVTAAMSARRLLLAGRCAPAVAAGRDAQDGCIRAATRRHEAFGKRKSPRAGRGLSGSGGVRGIRTLDRAFDPILP